MNKERRKYLKQMRRAVWEKSNGKCWYCGVKFHWDEPLTVDHLIPTTRGGIDHLDNLVPCCSLCNSQKGTRTLEEFRRVKSGWGVIFTDRHIELLEALGINDIQVRQEDLINRHEFEFEYREKCRKGAEAATPDQWVSQFKGNPWLVD
jgi:hypothetical protein